MSDSPTRGVPTSDAIPDRYIRSVEIILFSTLTGGLLVHLLPRPEGFPSWITLLVLVFSMVFAAVTVRSGGGVVASLISGYAIGFFELHRVWLDTPYGGSPLHDGALLVYLSWEFARLLLISSTAGFIVGAVWLHRNELREEAGWILSRTLIAVSVTLVIVGGWYLTGDLHPARFL